MISTHEAIQCLVFTMVILTLDAILSSRMSVITPSLWFGTAFGRYSLRNMMSLWLWYCKWRTTPSQQIINAMKLIQSFNKVQKASINFTHENSRILHFTILSIRTWRWIFAHVEMYSNSEYCIDANYCKTLEKPEVA